MARIYEFCVTTLSHSEPEWNVFFIPLANTSLGTSSTLALNQTNSTLLSSTKFEATVISSTSVALTWPNFDNLIKLFEVCYFPLKDTRRSCDEEKLLKR